MIRNRAFSTDWTAHVSGKPKISKSLNIDSSFDFNSQLILFQRPTVKTLTDATYTGEWNVLGYAGRGKYVFPNGVVYFGKFKDSMFHGHGTLTFPMGQKIEGIWINGALTSWTFRFADGVQFSDPWNYCRFPDRRFLIEMDDKLRPVCDPILTNRQPTRKISIGFYDLEEGLFNAHTKCIISSINKNRIIRIPTAAEEEWITKNCRKGWDDPTGYRPDLYEVWTTGRPSSAHALNEYKAKNVVQIIESDVSSSTVSSDTTSDLLEEASEELLITSSCVLDPEKLLKIEFLGEMD